MKKKLAAMVLAFVVALGMGLGVATPAQALPTGCTSGWSLWYGPSWGKMRLCYAIAADDFQRIWWAFQVQDTQTDGYVVHLEACADSAWNGNGSITTPYSCHDPGTPPPYDPLWGLVLVDLAPSDKCIQSSGAVVGSRSWPSAITPQEGWDPQHSYFEVMITKGRCEGGSYQAVDRYQVILQNAGSGTLQ